MKRHGSVIGLSPSGVEEYKRLHADVWPDVLKRIGESNICNYSIFLKEPENLLFSYFEYVGSSFEADMQAIADDPETQRWWTVCMPLQKPLENRKEGEWWAEMEEVFHND